MGVPGWPELACCTASIANVLMVLMHNWSSLAASSVIDTWLIGYSPLTRLGWDSRPAAEASIVSFADLDRPSSVLFQPKATQNLLLTIAYQIEPDVG
jgi:hypothetical protein